MKVSANEIKISIISTSNLQIVYNVPKNVPLPDVPNLCSQLFFSSARIFLIPKELLLNGYQAILGVFLRAYCNFFKLLLKKTIE